MLKPGAWHYSPAGTEANNEQKFASQGGDSVMGHPIAIGFEMFMVFPAEYFEKGTFVLVR